MDLSALLEESSLYALCYTAMGKLRPQSCSVPKVTQHVRSAIFSSSAFLVSHPILVEYRRDSNSYMGNESRYGLCPPPLHIPPCSVTTEFQRRAISSSFTIR